MVLRNVEGHLTVSRMEYGKQKAWAPTHIPVAAVTDIMY